jgi:N-acetylmuramoyl-L-alanine amidase
MALTAVAFGQSRSADVYYTYFDDAPTHGFRVGDECFVPIEDVERWGWQVSANPDSADITAEGMQINIPIRNISGRNALPLRAAISKLGGSADWIVNSDTLQVVCELTSVSVDSGHVKVSCPFQYKQKATNLTDPSRVVIDFFGARIGSKTTQTLEGGVRLTQYKPNVVRLVIQTQGNVDVSRVTTDPTKASDFQLPLGQQAPTKQPAVVQTKPDTISTFPTTVPPITDSGVVNGSATASTGDLPLSLDSEDDHSAKLSMKFSSGQKVQPQFDKPSPTVLQITLPGIFMDLAPDFKIESSTVISATNTKTAKGTVLTLNLVRPVGAEVYTEGSSVYIQLSKPNVGDGKLLGKVVVVDAGHGGWDNGASGGGLHEKNFTLQLARLLSDRLTEEGATVIMTRKSDVFIPLETRADIANKNHADFFISCHINDTGGTSKASGTITFHHMKNTISKVLAECIQQQFGGVNQLPSIGVWSDGRIYANEGFSVLRNIKMVGVLIEFGFINNAHDRSVMSTDQFQDSMSRAVVRGLKVYLGDAKTK